MTWETAGNRFFLEKKKIETYSEPSPKAQMKRLVYMDRCTWHPQLVHLIGGSLYPVTNVSHFPDPQPLATPFYSLRFWVWLFKTSHSNEFMQYLSFVPGLFYLAYCFPGSSTLSQKARFPSLLKLNNIPLCVHTCVCVCMSSLPVQPSMAI